MHRVIFAGSPRAGGRTAALADAIFEACIEDAPQDGVSVVSVSGMQVAGCMGCNACKAAKSPASSSVDAGDDPDACAKDDPLAPAALVQDSDAQAHVCVISDDMTEFRRHIDAADELIVVCPVYFSSVPAQAKAVLDRLQPYFYSDIRAYTKTRRPMTVHIVGEAAGGDPYGAEALVATLRSAFGVAGFKLERLLDWTGCIDEQGEILQEAREIDLSTIKINPLFAEGKAGARYTQGAGQDVSTASPDYSKGNNADAKCPATRTSRPKLDVHSQRATSPSAQKKSRKKGRK